MKKVKELLKMNKKFKVSVLVAIVLCLTLIFFSFITDRSYAANGIYGTCAWDIDANGKLTLAPQSGDTSCTLGSVSYASRLPWYSNRTDVLSVEVSQGVIANANSTSLFSLLSNVTTLDVTNLDTTNVTNMYGMFESCSSLTSLDVTNFDTSNVTDMRYLFNNCSKLVTITGLAYFNTSNVTRMNSMFQDCASLTSIVGITYFDTSKVTVMDGMFNNCNKLTSLDVTGFDTSQVTSMNSIFYKCSSLTNLDVTHFDTSNVTSMVSMFRDCISLTSLDVTHFDTSNVTNMGVMFERCNKLTNLDVTHFNTSNVTDMGLMFSGCSSLTNLDVTHFNTSNVTDMGNMFENCSSLLNLDVTHFDTSNVTDMSGMFRMCLKLVDLDVSHFNTSNVTTLWDMFEHCESLTNLDVTNFNTSNVTDMGLMFQFCYRISYLNLSNFDMINVTNVDRMFQGLGGNNNNGCKITLNNTFDKDYVGTGSDSNDKYKFSWSYYAKEVNGQLQGFYTLSEMQTETTGSNTPTTWVPAYSVTYDGNGGTIGGNNTLVKSYRIGSKIPTRGITPVKTGAHYSKFTNTQSGTSSSITINRNAESTNAYGSKYVGLSSPFSNGNVTLYAQYTTDPDTTMTVNRKITGASGSITNTFGYTITPDSNNPATVGNIPSTFNIVFNGDSASGGYIQKGTNIDFNNATYTLAGDYKFTVRENSSTDSTTYPLSNDEWEVYINVRNVVDYDNVPTGEFTRTTYMKKVGSSEKGNNMLFEANMALTNIKITTSVEGNMADADEYFKLKVNVGGSGTYTLSGLDSSVTYEGNPVTNPSTITAGQDTYIYVKHGEDVYIGKNNALNEVPSGVTYRVIEEGASNYTTSINGTAGKDSGNKTTNLTSNNLTILNEWNSPVATGVILKALPYIFLVLVVLSGLILFILIKKKSKNI